LYLQKEHWEDLTTLILVAGHAVYVADNFDDPSSDDNWFLQSFQKGEPPFYIEHIMYGVDRAASEPRSLLVFSGGQTRLEAGPRSEAQSYWMLADHFSWWHRPSVRLRATTEEFARDSFENLLFGICRFKECTGHYPDCLEVVSWTFKYLRFQLHREAMKWPELPERYKFHGVNNPVDLAGAQKGEAKAVAAFKEDPFGTEAELASKRAERNPFNRQNPYSAGCKELESLLNHKTPNGKEYKGKLPWRSI